MTRPSHSAQTVLVVEDEGLVRLDAVETLREAGFDVVEADDAAAALDIVAGRADIGVLFTDINMPGGMNGLELARCIHRTHPAIELILTSGAVTPAPDEIPDDGVFLAKPYSPEAVTSAVSAKLA
jgi:CheY-like chemotaxis protein